MKIVEICLKCKNHVSPCCGGNFCDKSEPKTYRLCEIQPENDVCLGCPEPCTRRGLEGRCVTHQNDKPRLEDLEFGTEIEIFSVNPRPARWCGLRVSDDHPLALIDGKIWDINFTEWRLPIKSRIRKGQPLVCDISRKWAFFINFTSGTIVSCYSGIDLIQSFTTWRLPTKEELKQIGQDNLGWLTSD